MLDITCEVEPFNLVSHVLIVQERVTLEFEDVRH